MNIVVVEDEPLNVKSLRKLIKQIKPDAEVINELDTVAASVDWFKTHPQPDLLFMDIQLADGISFDIFKEVEITAPIIFTTAYDKYAIHAFKVNSIDYLLKPIELEALQNAFEKLQRLHASTNILNEQLHRFLQSIRNPEKQYNERFLVHDKGGMAPIPAHDVAYFVKESIIYLVTNSNQKLVTDYHTLDELEEIVNPTQFIRANRQILLHKNQVASYKKHYTGKMTVHIKLDPNTELDVSREKSHDFLHWLEH
jgi:two-component system LytT family response regulator